MINVLVSPDDEIVINFVIATTKDGHIIAEANEKMLKEGDDNLDESTIQYHKAIFRRPNFGDLVKITGNLTLTIGENFSFNPTAIRLARITHLIKSWTLVDTEGKPIPPTSENIFKLNFHVANAIGIQLDSEIS